MSGSLDTLFSKYAPAFRAEQKLIDAQVRDFQKMEGTIEFLNALIDCAFIVNSHRQIVFANGVFLETFSQKAPDIYGKRLGEIIDCEHSILEEGGCGTSEFCSVCGAVNSILQAANCRTDDTRECLITTLNLDALELEVHSHPYENELGKFVFVTMKDIGKQKRKDALESIFYHDILNTAGGMRGVVELLALGEATPEFNEIALHLADQLIDEISAQRTLSSAESGQLIVKTQLTPASEVISEVAVVFKTHEAAQGKKLVFDTKDADFELETDPTILRRILINMTKNACEASAKDERITVAARVQGNKAIFEVSNPGVMDPKSQLMVFKRSFSTKGPGRGLGTYSMRLLGEKYLKGSVNFRSATGEGTTFWVELDLNGE
jgi:nitrogen-specific signal transduction histidine kinase